MLAAQLVRDPSIADKPEKWAVGPAPLVYLDNIGISPRPPSGRLEAGIPADAWESGLLLDRTPPGDKSRKRTSDKIAASPDGAGKSAAYEMLDTETAARVTLHGMQILRADQIDLRGREAKTLLEFELPLLRVHMERLAECYRQWVLTPAGARDGPQGGHISRLIHAGSLAFWAQVQPQVVGSPRTFSWAAYHAGVPVSEQQFIGDSLLGFFDRMKWLNNPSFTDADRRRNPSVGYLPGPTSSGTIARTYDRALQTMWEALRTNGANLVDLPDGSQETVAEHVGMVYNDNLNKVYLGIQTNDGAYREALMRYVGPFGRNLLGDELVPIRVDKSAVYAVRQPDGSLRAEDSPIVQAARWLTETEVCDQPVGTVVNLLTDTGKYFGDLDALDLDVHMNGVAGDPVSNTVNGKYLGPSEHGQLILDRIFGLLRQIGVYDDDQERNPWSP